MNAKKLLINGLNELGVSSSDSHIKAFMAYLAELKKWNRAYNLTALRSDDDIITKHFFDSLLYLEGIPEGTLNLADAGTGAGFPGIPLKIVRPELEVFLVEASRKKAAFLRNIIRQLHLAGIHVLEQRMERLGIEHKKKYDVITSRATFSIREFLSIACPYASDRGILILNKGPRFAEELSEIEESDFSQAAVLEVKELILPFTGARRNLILLSCTMGK